MAQRLIAIADTHLPRFGRELPRPLIDALTGADLILHAGDLIERFVIDLLSAHAPVVAVAGNNDEPELARELGTHRVVEMGGVRIGVTHGHIRPGSTTPIRARRRLADVVPPVDAVVFGHSHQPMVERHGALWMLNPGSPTDRRRSPTFSFLQLDIDAGELRPILRTYSQRR